MAGRTAKPKPTKTLEQRLWDAADGAAALELGDDILKKIAQELVAAVRASATIDWNLKEPVRDAGRSVGPRRRLHRP